MQIFDHELSLGSKLMLILRLLTMVATSISLFVLVLAGLEFITGHVLSHFGFKLQISDEIRKTVIAIGGAIAVALVALFGVHRQNLSAERRHRTDSRLALRKEIFLKVAEAAAAQYQLLLSLAEGPINKELNVEFQRKTASAFFQLQMVANESTIAAMLDANEEWSRAYIDIIC